MNNKGTRIYGRAQRIEFFQKVIYFVIAVFAIAIVFIILSNRKESVDDNVNFSYLREYMEANGYSCEMIHQNGGTCTLKSDASTSMFIRQNNGFEFIITSETYNLDIKHIPDDDKITFNTTAKALAGYKSTDYTCTTKGTILDELDKCVDKDNNELTSNAYISVVEMAIKDLNNFVDSSGYRKDVLLENYEWVK